MARTKNFIQNPSDELLAKFPKAVQGLVKKGRSQGFVTQQELLKAMPNIENDLILLDEIYTLFMELGIEVLDMKHSLIWGEEEEKEEEEIDKKDKKEKDSKKKKQKKLKKKRKKGKKRKRKQGHKLN